MAVATAKIQATINGVVTTIGEVAIADVSNLVNATATSQAVAMSLSRPIRVDKGTAINLVTVQNSGVGISTIASGTVHVINHERPA